MGVTDCTGWRALVGVHRHTLAMQCNAAVADHKHAIDPIEKEGPGRAFPWTSYWICYLGSENCWDSVSSLQNIIRVVATRVRGVKREYERNILKQLALFTRCELC